VESFEFGSFRLDGGARVISHAGRRVSLRGKAFDLLQLLASRAGELVDKAALLHALWPGVTVHDNNIAVTVRSVRKALLAHDPAIDYIETVPGRGYRFTQPALRLARAPQPVPVAADRRALRDEPFVAREAELDELTRRWTAACQGAGSALFVSGEPGIGKSALLRRFVERARRAAPEALLLEGECLQLFGAAEPHLPVLSALAGGLRGAGRGALLAALEQHAPGWLARFPPALVGTGVNRDTQAGAHPLADALHALSRAHPLLLVLEDLHWADPSSLDLVRMLLSGAAAHRLLLIGTYRPADAANAGPALRSALTAAAALESRAELVLEAWSPPQLERYLSERFASPALAARLSPRIWRHTEGQPLFTVRLIDALLERGVVLRDGSQRWQLQGSNEVELRAPPSVEALLDSHLERLVPNTRHVLAVASVDGREFGTALLASVLEQTPADVEDELDGAARAHGLIERIGQREGAGGALDVRYRFRHVLYQEHLYRRLGSHRRVDLHQRFARAWLDARAPEPPAPSRVALHFELGRDDSRAVEYWTRAGDQADRAYAKREALACYERAARLLARLGAGERELRELVLAHGRGWAHLGLGEPAAARRQFLEFARLTQQLRLARGPQRELSLRLAREYFEQPWADTVLRRPTGILPRRAQTALELELCAEALHCCCHVASAADLSEDLLEHAAALRALAEAGASPPRRAEALAWLGTHALAVGRARQARAALDEAVALSRAIEHERALRVALAQRAQLYLLQGQLARAQAAFEELLARVPDARGAADTLTQLGDVHAERGEPALALRSHASADVLRQRSLPGYPALHGWLLRELGQLDVARRLDETAVERLEPTAPAALVSRLHASLASTACRQGDLPAARRHVAAAEALVPAAHRDCSFRMGRIWAARSELLAAEGAWEVSTELGRGWLVSARARADAGGVRAARRCLALAFLSAGEPRRALRQVRQALAAAAAHPLPLSDWRSHALEAHIALHLGDGSAARSARQLVSDKLGALARRLDGSGEHLCVAQLGEITASL